MQMTPASPALSITRYAIVSGDVRAVEFDGYRYDPDGNLEGSMWKLIDEAPFDFTGITAYLWPLGQRIELTEADLLPLVTLNIPSTENSDAPR